MADIQFINQRIDGTLYLKQPLGERVFARQSVNIGNTKWRIVFTGASQAVNMNTLCIHIAAKQCGELFIGLYAPRINNLETRVGTVLQKISDG